MTTVAAIIQARMGSSRLRGKVLEDLAGQPVLAHVVQRARLVPGVDIVCCAVPDEPTSEPVARLAAALGTRVHRGPGQDVLARYAGAAAACGADVVMRITSDCPLIDPQISGNVLSHFLKTNAAYCSNVDPRSWPKGLDTEIFTAAALSDAAAAATEPQDREHVTPWIRRNPSIKRSSLVNTGADYSALRWTLDYPEDLAFLRALYRLLPSPPAVATFAQILAVAQAHPEIVALNAHLR